MHSANGFSMGHIMTTTESKAPSRVPIVDYLVIDDGAPHLVAHECTSCSARFTGRRNGCGRCGGVELQDVELASTGLVRSATRIHRSAPGIRVPYVSIVVDVDGGGAVKATYLGDQSTEIESLLGKQVRLSTQPVGIDESGTEAIGFGYVDAVTGLHDREVA
jgi:uncharacterized OB-fold protein